MGGNIFSLLQITCILDVNAIKIRITTKESQAFWGIPKKIYGRNYITSPPTCGHSLSVYMLHERGTGSEGITA